MHCIRKLSDDLIWIGASEHRAARFENHYPVPEGMSYNSYVLLDEKAVLFDTADSAVAEIFFENLDQALAGRALDPDGAPQRPRPPPPSLCGSWRPVLRRCGPRRWNKPSLRSCAAWGRKISPACRT